MYKNSVCGKPHPRDLFQFQHRKRNPKLLLFAWFLCWINNFYSIYYSVQDFSVLFYYLNKFFTLLKHMTSLFNFPNSQTSSQTSRSSFAYLLIWRNFILNFKVNEKNFLIYRSLICKKIYALWIMWKLKSHLLWEAECPSYFLVLGFCPLNVK